MATPPTLIAQLLHDHRSTHSISCLHVTSTNRRAIDIYLRLGFQTLREVVLHRLVRVDEIPAPNPKKMPQ